VLGAACAPGTPHELEARPDLLFELKRYARARLARLELPFLFSAFESGQAPPPGHESRPRASPAEPPAAGAFPAPPGRTAPRPAGAPAPAAAGAEEHVPTIHEYLDWSVTGECPRAERDQTLDFEGFHVILARPRHRPQWPRPDDPPPPAAAPGSGLPVPAVAPSGRALVAATLRTGAGYLEVPFFATVPSRQRRGFGRALLGAIEEVARRAGVGTILLCSTNDPLTLLVWRRLGFVTEGVEEEWARLGVQVGGRGGLLDLQFTTHMWKAVPPRPPFRRLRIVHRNHVQRVSWGLEPRPRVELPPGLEEAVAAAYGGAPPADKARDADGEGSKGEGAGPPGGAPSGARKPGREGQAPAGGGGGAAGSPGEPSGRGGAEGRAPAANGARPMPARSPPDINGRAGPASAAAGGGEPEPGSKRLRVGAAGDSALGAPHASASWV